MLAKQELEEATELCPVRVVEQSIAYISYFSKVLPVNLKSCWDRRNTGKEYCRTALPNVLRYSCNRERQYENRTEISMTAKLTYLQYFTPVVIRPVWP